MPSQLNIDDETLCALLYEAWRAVQAVAVPTGANDVNGVVDPRQVLCVECGGMVPDLREEGGHKADCPFGGLVRLVGKVVVRTGEGGSK